MASLAKGRTPKYGFDLFVVVGAPARRSGLSDASSRLSLPAGIDRSMPREHATVHTFMREPGRPVGRDAAQTNQTGWLRWLPGVETLRRYEASWLKDDVMAGIVMTTMLVPVGIAYGQASGVPGINGLYATIVPLLAYALFGPSRILILGPDSALTAVILTVVLPLSGGDATRAVALGGM